MPTSSEVRLKPLKPEASRIFKLCLEKELGGLKQGLELAKALGKPLDGVLDEIGINQSTGELIKGKRFTGNPKTQPMLDALLLLQLSLAPKGTPAYDIRNQIKKLSCISPVLPTLETFRSLEELELKFTPEFRSPDLLPLGPMPKLKKLSFERHTTLYGSDNPILETLNGLHANQLEYLSSPHMCLHDVSALTACTKLTYLCLRGIDITTISALTSSAASLKEVDLSYCRDLQSLAPLREAINIEHLQIAELKQIKDLGDLKKLSKLRTLDFSDCESLESLQGIPLRELTSSQENFGQKPGSWLYLNNMKSLKSLDGLPPLSPNVVEFSINDAKALVSIDGLKASAGSIKKLKISEAKIADLTALAKLIHLEELEITSCPELVDACALGSLKNLRIISIKNCVKLEKLPEIWRSHVTSLSLSGCSNLKPIKGLPPGINSKTIEIDDRRLLPRAKPARPLKSDLSSAWKLLSSRNFADILMGLELSSVVEGGLEVLHEGVSVKDGKLERGKRFTGTGPAQPYLDFALFGLMGKAKGGSPLAIIREKITELNLTLASTAPPLEGLSNLETLCLTPIDGIAPDLSKFGPMPKLKTLKITGRRWNPLGGLKTLQGLIAPKLKEVDLSSIQMEDISALMQSPEITSLSLQENESLVNLEGIKACAPNLLEFNLEGCKQVAHLDPLAEATKLEALNLQQCESICSLEPLASCKSLHTLNIENCKNLLSLKGLEKLPLEYKANYSGNFEFSLDGCISLTSLEYFPLSNDLITHLSLTNTKSLKNFSGLPQLSKVSNLNATNSGLVSLKDVISMPALKEIDFNNCSSLQDARPLGALSNLKTIDLSKSGVEEMPQSWSSSVTEITLKDCDSLKSLGKLPESLKSLVCDGSKSLSKLDGIAFSKSLESISAEGCSALTDLGEPPATLKKVIANYCTQLNTLKGLPPCSMLEFIGMPLSITDISAIINIPQITIDINLHEIILEKNNPKTSATLPKAFKEALNKLKSINLQIKGPSSYWGNKTESIFDLASINQLRNLHTLSLREYDINCSFDSLVWLVPIQNLQGLWFYPRGNLSYKLGSSIYDSPGKVRELQLRICQEAKLPPPPHLLAK
ncbi:hypothetical protein ICN19_00390 [Polynucleobacter sp. AP-Capit-er-40B-B4]|uniref:hypothetical protein n=1 Tax=Polynucleobacter sp. AP-Capit-er-40B-B4 TaxID=2576927 RepID=UPI001C0B022C|nr:hypothetical protein [Polynucleobacter sp. AP-Capit-er-40B-B4]MBU3580468.1 hypothetical protein [Polynucleobacter sp. AP-Capit-er-40B-B4]